MKISLKNICLGIATFLILFPRISEAILLSELTLKEGQRIGIYIGTFDPIHVGHSSVVEQSLKDGKLDYVLVIPNSAAHKPNALPFIHRLQMVKSLYEDSPNIVVPDGPEIGNDIAYSFLDKVNSQKLPAVRLIQIYGDDVVASVETQRKERAQYKGISEWIIMARSDESIGQIDEIKKALVKENPDLKIQVLKSTDPGHSSTKIKASIAHAHEGKKVSDLDERVLSYIKAEGLYQIPKGNVLVNQEADKCSILYRSLGDFNVPEAE
ncbi:MAG: adenylyltransferase/cytidyltransferase family protein [Bacteriovorax sp.]|nr:adenylyltransferase/cytidyltransferase family protein [Bacteriovorax sp.]